MFGSGCSRVEHRLVGADTCPCRKYKPVPVRRAWQWNAIGWGEALDTLLGPEGSGNTAGCWFPVVVVVEPGFFWMWALPKLQFVCGGCGVPVVC